MQSQNSMMTSSLQTQFFYTVYGFNIKILILKVPKVKSTFYAGWPLSESDTLY